MPFSVPWGEIGIIILKTSIVYWMMIFGLKLIGRRALGQMGPHEFILIALLAKIMGDHIVSETSDFWGNLAGGLTLFFYVGLIERVQTLREFIQGSPIPLLRNGIPDQRALKRHHFTDEDLYRVARTYGFSSYDVFESIILERDGRLSGTVKPEYRH